MALKINGVRVAGVGANGRDGAGVIPGGKSGQILSKRSDVDHDTVWTDLPPIDATLSQEGQAADAKAVGDQINTINNIVSEGDESTLSSAKNYTDEQIADLVNSAPETLNTLGELAIAFNENKEVVEALDSAITNKKDKDLIVTYAEGSTFDVTHSAQEIYEAVQNGTTVYFQKGTELLNLMEITSDYATFFMFYMNMEGKSQQKVVVINGNSIMLDQDDTYNYATTAQLDNVLVKTEQTLTDAELTQVRSNLKFIGKDVEGQTFNINGEDIVAAANAEIFGDYENNKCTGQWSIVEGSANIATGRVCHVEGAQNQALADGCHVEGVSCIASGYWSHAEGEMTRVTSYASHAEGSYTKMPDGTTRYGTASGYASHIEGGGCHAQGSCSHSEGLATTTKGNYSHSEGKYTIASSPAQHVQGAGNIEDANSIYLHIVGNGDFGAPSNAHTLDWDGNAWFSGDVYVGSTSGTNRDEGSKKLATQEYIDIRVPAWTAEDEGKVLKIINNTPVWVSSESKIIKFYINEFEYEAEEGMKWKYWPASRYNFDTYYKYDKQLNRISDADNHIGLNGDFIKGEDIITANCYYEVIMDNSQDI